MSSLISNEDVYAQNLLFFWKKEKSLGFQTMLEKNCKSVVSLIWSCFVNMFRDIFFWGADLKKHLRHHMQHARVPSRDLQSVFCIDTELLNQEWKHKTFYFITLNKHTHTSQKGGADYRLKCEYKCCISWSDSSDSPSFYSSLCHEWTLNNLHIFRTAYQKVKVIICAVICWILYKLFIIAERKKLIFSFKKQPYSTGKMLHFFIS